MLASRVEQCLRCPLPAFVVCQKVDWRFQCPCSSPGYLSKPTSSDIGQSSNLGRGFTSYDMDITSYFHIEQLFLI